MDIEQEKYISSNNDKSKEKNKINNNIDSFKVYIRIKPNVPKEKNNKGNYVISINNPNNNHAISKSLTKDLANITLSENEKNQMLKIDKNILYLEDIKNHKNKNNKTFLFDNIFNETSKNQNIFSEAIKPMVDKILLGYNSTTLAYGATDTGKTYTIFGDLISNSQDEGIIFKACDYLFEKIELNKKEENIKNMDTNYLIKISYFEIYNEIVRDLISENSSPILLVEDPQKGIICQNAKELTINDSIELKKIINESNKRRTMASTNQNQFSSRSHAILQMNLEKRQKINLDSYEVHNSKFLIVDLAGSERGSEKGKRREEGVNINKSLFTLSNCLNILSEKSNTGKFVPYRDSKLTRLLKDSLGGNIITVMIACISSLSCNYDDTLSTLNYAFKAKKITKKVMKNIKEINFNTLQYKEMIDSLKNEIIQLKNIIKNQEIKLNKQISENIEKKEKSEQKDIILNNDKLNENEKNILLEENPNDLSMKEKDNKNEDNIPQDIELNIVNIDTDIYNNYIEEISYENFNIDNLNNHIESLKKDKNILENYLFNNNIKNENLNNKYNAMKKVYNKYIEIINEKLVESIEQNFLFNFNIKEIEELNKINNDKIIELEKKDKDEKIIEEINYTKKNLEENIIQKNQIIESIKRNDEQKKELQKILLNLLDNKSDSMNQYINIMKEKDKLFKITKQYEKEIENYVKIQKQKDEDINKINRKIEMLRAKLKEKDKKINELEKKGGIKKLRIKNFKYNKLELNENFKTENEKNKNSKISYKCYINNFKRNDSKNNKKEKNEILSPANKGLRKTMKQKKISYSNISKGKIIINNQSFNNTKRFSVMPNKDKILNNYTKINNINYKTENNDENINISNYNNFYEIKKCKDLTIPITTITLTDIEHPTKSKNHNQKYLKFNKSFKKNNIKNNNNRTIINKNIEKKYSLIIHQISNKSTSSNSGIIKKLKKNLIKSVRVDLKSKNFSPEIKSDESLKQYMSDKNIKSKEENNLAIIKPFKTETLSIDLNKLQNKENSFINDINEKINCIKLAKETTKKNKIPNTNRNSLSININKFKLSKSNPKFLVEKKSNKKMTKKYSLNEARYENKLQYEKRTDKKNVLNRAEIFINEYQKMKSDKSFEIHNYSIKNKNHSLDKNKTEEIDKKSCNTIIQNIQIYLNEDDKSERNNN